MDIRAAKRDEADALTQLTYRSKAHWGYPDDLMNAWMDDLRVTPEYLDKNPAFVAEEDGALLGYYSFICSGEPGAWGELQVPAGCWLDNLFVEPAHIGAGVGAKLFRHAVGAASQRGLGRFFIVSDPNSLGFYCRMGATPLGEKPSDAMPGRMLPVLRMDLSPAAPALHVRRATEADSPRLTEITLQGKRHWRYPEEYFTRWGDWLSMPPAYIQSNPTFTAEVSGHIVGYISFAWQESTHLGDQIIGPAWWLDGLFIDPMYIGTGLGRRLYQKAVELAREQGITALYIASDPNALGFYKRMGAMQVAELPTQVEGYVKPILLHRLADNEN